MMTQLMIRERESTTTADSTSAPRLVQLADRILQCIDRKLGYFGRDRFVCFRYEPRGEEVVWRDGHSCGFGTGGWRVFMEQVEPLTHRYGVDLGSNGSPGDHVLLIDRGVGLAYFADRHSGEDLVERQAIVA